VHALHHRQEDVNVTQPVSLRWRVCRYRKATVCR